MPSDAATPAAAPGMVDRRPALARIDLPAALLILGVLELVLHRWGPRLFYAGPLGRISGGAQTLDFVGRFAFHAMALVGIATLVYLSVAVLWRSDLFALPLRLVFLAALTYLLPSVLAAVVTRGTSETLLLHVRLGATAVATVMFVGVLLAPGEPRAKCGIGCLLMPVWCALYAALAAAYPVLAPGGDVTGLPTQSLRVGESAVIAAGLVSFLCFMPVPRALRLGGLGPLLVATAVAVGAALLSARRFDLAVRAASYGFGIELPLSLGLRSVYLAGLFSVALTSLALIGEGGAARVRGIGVALFVLAGYQPQHPLQLLLMATGAVALVLATAQPRAGVPAPIPVSVPLFEDAAWRRYVAGLTQALAAQAPAAGPAPEAVVVDGDEGLVTRVRAVVDEVPLTLRYRCRDGEVRDVDFALGPCEGGLPLLTLSSRGGGARGAGPSAEGPVVETGDRDFDHAVKMRGRADLVDTLDAPLRAELAALRGWIGVFAGGGVRYHAAPSHPGAIDQVVPAAAVAAADPAAVTATTAALATLLEVARRTRR